MSFQLRIQGPEKTWVFPLTGGQTVTIGRDSVREICLPHPLVSRLHAQLECREAECQVTDLGSANGTLVGGEMITAQVPVILKPGDLVSIGPFEITIEQAAVEDAPAAPKDPQTNIGISQPAEPAPEEPEKDNGQAAQQPLVKKALKTGKKKEPAPVQSVESAGEGTDQAAAPPPVEPPETSAGAARSHPPENGIVPPGLSLYSQKLIAYLPGIYQTDFMSRFLGLFESIMIPVEWTVGNFDLFLDPKTSPEDFIPWLANWFEISFDDSWTEGKRRQFLSEAHVIYARRGTRWALERVLEIYTGQAAEVVDQDLEPHTFQVNLPVKEASVKRELLEKIINTHKPVQTTYTLTFKG